MRSLSVRRKIFLVLMTFALFVCLAAGLCFMQGRTASAFTSDGAFSAIEQGAGAKFAGEDYLALYAVPTSAFEYTNNGGGEIARAFDGDFSTQWTSEKQNSRTDTGAAAEFYNEIDVTFHTPVLFDRILYQASDARVAHGYPQELEVFVRENGAERSLGVCKSSPTVNRVVFNIGQVTAEAVRFVFLQPNTSHNWVATAKELVFLTPEDAELDKLAHLFSDYAETQVKAEIDDAFLSAARARFSSRLNYETAIEPILSRAEGMRNGTLRKEAVREYGTALIGANRIERFGNIRGYSANTLKFSTFGIDYQPTGIAGRGGEKLTVYVEAGENDPLPKLVCTQVFGDWRSWLVRYDLVRGKNVITFPDFVGNSPDVYTVRPSEGLFSGGPVYLENPYDTTQQSKSVRVYIEGGEFYPVFREGGDETAFLRELNSYLEKRREAPERYPDVAELVSDHVIATSLSTAAYDLFADGQNSLQASCDGWDGFMEELLAFGGVSFDENDEHYNDIHRHLRHNLRLAQPWAGALAYASGGFCGFCVDKYGDSFHLLRYGVYGWAMAHELGHALDNNMGAAGRTTAEVTNNMWSIYNHVYLEKNAWDRPNLPVFRNELAPDAEPATKSYELHRGTGYVFWWQIESRYPGFWGKMENMYRYRDVDADLAAAGVTDEEKKLLTQEERHAYLCSLAAETDLTYYFDRWGFYFGTKKVGEGESAKEVPANMFDADTLSAAYTKLMDRARGQGAFPLPALKFWYTDYANYPYMRTNGTGLYSEESKATVLDVFGTESGYTIFLPAREEEAHLGYEISEGDRVIGFTDGCMFTDTNVYPAGYTPVYTVRAYDRLLNCSARSASVSPAAASEAVCRIGETPYSSLSAAVNAAGEGDVIELLAEARTGAVVIDKNITVAGSFTVRRGAAGHLFTVKNGATLTLRGGERERNALRIDGGNFPQNGSLLFVETGGALACEGCVMLENNRTSGDGGAILSAADLTLSGLVLRGNSARNGGALFVDGNRETVCTAVRFDKNTASQDGGAVHQRGTITLDGCTLTVNGAQNGGAVYNHSGGIANVNGTRLERNTAENAGGGLYTDGAANLGTGSVFSGNRASLGGGVYFGASNTARKAAVTAGETPVKFKSNAATKGGAMYVKSAATVTVNEVAVVGNRADEGSVLYLETGTVTFPSVPAVTPDFTFEGWLLNGTATMTLDGLNAGDRLDADGKVRYYVTYFADDEQYGESELFEAGASVELPAFTGQTERRRFMGWEVNGTEHAAGETVVLQEDITANAVFKNEYGATVTSDGVVLQKKTVLEGEAFILPDAPEAPKGKVFKGWQVHSTLRAPGDEIYLTADVEISAVFEDAGSSVVLIVSVTLGVTAAVAMGATILGIHLHGKRKLRQ